MYSETSDPEFGVTEWTDQGIQQTPEFTETVRDTNIRGLTISAGVAWFGLLLFWIPDHFVMPDLVTESLMIRVPVSLFSFFIFCSALKKTDWMRKHSHWWGIALFVVIGASLTPLCWMAGGLESQYYAAFNLMFIGIVLFFNFSRLATFSLLWGNYALYISPLLVGNYFPGLNLTVTDAVQVFNNQFFLLSTLTFCTVGYHFRYQLIIDGVRYTLQQRNIKKKLAYRANHDHLTGVLNRRSWFKKTNGDNGNSEPKDGGSSRTHHWILMLDLDHFKKVNDEFGHQAGDKVLKEIAQIIEDTIRSNDKVARYGGEEFIVELADTKRIEVVAERLRSSIDDHSFEHANELIPVTVSIGIARWKPDQSKERVINLADKALYQAKSEGRNRVKIREPANSCNKTVGDNFLNSHDQGRNVPGE